MEIILASKSPRRRELLSIIVPTFTVFDPNVDETVSGDMTVQERISAISLKKAQAAKAVSRNGIIISADTAVVVNDKILGKPKDQKDAFDMLSLLSGKTHTVITGLTVLYGDKTVSESVLTDVTFRKLKESEIAEYIADGEPMDKAGAYGIQGKGGAFVSSIKGDYFSVVGLPICRLKEILNEIGGN